MEEQMTDLTETWLQYNDEYMASNFGRVKSVDRVVLSTYKGKKKNVNLKGKVLKPSKNSNGYLMVVICKEGYSKTVSVHSIISHSFLGKRPHSKVVDHINNIPSDNRLINLQYISHRENCSKDKWRYNYYSKYVGVREGKGGKFVAEIYYIDKVIHLGTFNTELEAYKARKNAEAEVDNNQKITIYPANRDLFTSIYKYISYDKGRGKWLVMFKGKNYGRFITEHEAKKKLDLVINNIK